MRRDAQRRIVGRVLGVPIDVVTWREALERLLAWATARESRYVVICNVHVTVSAARDIGYREVIDCADMALPDGAPVAWMLRRIGFNRQPRISGPDLLPKLAVVCAKKDIPVYFYGSTEDVLIRLSERLKISYPGLCIVGIEAPPFRNLSSKEDEDAVKRINDSGACIVFVGLGCPKQERWMAEHRDRIKGVMIGVGAAFDFYAGTLKRAPEWMRDNGLEWLHRLMIDPKRLWKRYLITNSLFLWGAFLQFTKLK